MSDEAGVVLTDDPPLYRDLMRLKPDDLTPNAWAVRAGVSRTVWSDMRRHGNPSRRTLEKLLAAANSSLAEFEALRVGEAPRMDAGEAGRLGDATASLWRAAPLPLIPVVNSSAAGEWIAGSGIELVSVDRRQVVDRIERPRSLAGDQSAYALTIIGDAMRPRFRPGKRIIVSPLAPVEIGDDVVVLLGGQERSLAVVKQVTRRTARLTELRQYNPDVRFTVDAAVIEGIHKVMGEAI